MKKYEYVANTLYNEIKTGYYGSGALLPTEEKLTKMYDVSRQTVRKALSILEEKGVIEKKTGQRLCGENKKSRSRQRKGICYCNIY